MPEQNAAFNWLASEFAAQLARVLESMAGEAPSVQFDPYVLPEAELVEQDFVWWEQPLNLSPDAVIWTGAGQQAWQGIGGRVLRAAGVEEDPETSRSTYLEILTQVLSGLTASISSRLHKETSLDAGQEAPPGAGSAAYSFQIGFPDLETRILASFSAPLGSLLSEPPAVQENPDAHPRRVLEPPPPPNSIDLLLDVELPVSISFGRAQLALKDVIKLTTGSIVELNRSVSEPVEVIVNNCVIARGEVVVVEGNFGIRIKQVISRQERLRTLN